MKIAEYRLEITEDEQVIEMPQYAIAHDVQLQYNEIVMWASIDEDTPLKNRTYVLRTTGSETGDTDLYIGTVQTQLVKVTYHLFQVYKAEELT